MLLRKDNAKTAQAAERLTLNNIKAGYKRLKINMSKSRIPEFIPKKKYKQTDAEQCCQPVGLIPGQNQSVIQDLNFFDYRYAEFHKLEIIRFDN